MPSSFPDDILMNEPGHSFSTSDDSIHQTLASKPLITLRLATVIGASILLVFALVMFVLRDNQDANTAFTDIGSFVIDGLVTLALFYGAVSSKKYDQRIYYAWLMMAAARFSYTLGDFIWAYMELALHESPFPSPSDIPALLSYPLFFMGILLLPGRKYTANERLKMMLDTGIVLIASVLIFWSLIIAPTIEQSAGADVLTTTLSVAYPVMDLIVLFAVLELLFKRIYMPGQHSLILLAAGIVTMIVTDAIFMRQSLDGTYVAGGLLDLGWPIGYILMGLAGIAQADAIRKAAFETAEDNSRYGQLTWPLYLPYFGAAASFMLLVWSHDHPIGLSFSTLSWAVGGIIGLVVVRQILALDDNASLIGEAQQEISVRKHAEKEITRLNEVLEARVAERTSQLEEANKELHSEILERTLAEEAMQDTERRLTDIINFLPDATFVINKEGSVIAWNRAIEKMTGIKASDILGKDNYEYSLPFYGVHRPILIDLVLNSDSKVEVTYESIRRQEDGSFTGESYIPSMNGRAVYLQGSAATLYDSDGNIYGVIESIRDITEQKLAEAELKNAKETAELATRAKSDFLANMSHEIRTPMNAVIGMTGLLMETDLDPEQQDYLETIKNSGNALLAVINDILDYSKIDGGKMVLEKLPFSLQNCIEESLDLLASKAAEKRLELVSLLDDGVPQMLNGDGNRLRQILVNLLGNAVKFTEAGEIVLSVSAHRQSGELFELHFAVRDTGIGISPVNMDKLFQSFSQVDSSTTRNYGGTGLGLAISKRLVEMMGGRIWAQSESGIGSIFHFTIQAQALEEKDFTPDDQLLRGRSALVVAGNEALREMIAKMFASWGMNVRAASSYEEANLARKMGHYDFAVVDVFLPDREDQSLVRSLLEMGLDLAGEDKSVQDHIGQDPLVKDQAREDQSIRDQIGHGQNQTNRDQFLDKMHIIMLIPVGYNVPREPKVSAWITKPVKPHQLYGAIHDLLTPPNVPGPQHPDRLRPSRKAEMKNLRILLAEDNQVNQKVALSMLRVLGYRADVSTSGLEVLQALETQPYDVILMDIQMPEMDGLETTRKVRSMSGRQPFIIAMTAYAMEGDRELCLEAGMDEYIRKPIKIEELQNVLASVERGLDDS